MKQNYFRSRLGFKNAGKLIALLLHLRKTSKVMALASVVCFTLVHNTYSQSISYVQPVDLASSGATVDGSPVGFTENPYAMAFSADGTKFYLGISNGVRQYTVGAPFDITASLTYDEVYLNTFSQVRDVRGITFSNDGMKLFVTGQFYDDVSQYSLSTAFDLSTASHEGTMQTLNISQACDVDFNNDGTKMYILGRSRERVNQYSLSTPFDITTGVTVDQYYDLPASISSSWALEFDPYGNKMYIMDNVDNKILQFDLTTPFDVSSGVTYEAEALDISNEEDGPLDINISPDGSLFHVVGWGPSGVNEEINQYQINSGPDFFETDANLGSVEGAVRIEIVGDLFTNAGGSFEHKSQYQLSSYPSGLIPNLNISADGTYATFTFTGIATNHQDINDVAQLTFTFVDGAFNSGNAASVENSNEADSDFGIDFEDNPTLSFSGPGFTETTENLGAVEGSLTVEIEGETFASSGQELTITTDYNIANVPNGLIPHLTVAGDGLSAVLTFTGESSMHQNTDDVSDIQFSFTNAAFQGGSAEVVIDADGASSNIGIDFNDNSPVLTHGYPYQIDNLTSKGSFVSTNEEDTPRGVTFNGTGTKMYIVGASSQSIHQYSLTQPYNITWGVTYDNVSFDVSNEDTDPRDIMFNSTGTKMYMLGLGTQGFYQYSLTTPYDVSTMSLEGSLIIGLGIPMGFTFDETGNTLIIALAGVLRQYSLTTAFDVTGTVNLEGSISILSTTDRIHGLEFDADGSSLFLINYKNKTVSKYSLTTPYDVLSGHTLAESFYLGNIDSQTLGMAMNEFGTRMFFVGQTSEAVIQLDMDAGGFVENPANDGSVTGEIVMQLYDDQFTNAGGTFIGGVEYIITNLPSGLSPLFSISADGSTATLTFSGNANSHSNNDDVQSLNISFLDAAFEIGDRDIVANNGNIEHGLGVDFGDGPVVTDETFTVLEGSPNFTVVGTVSATNPNMGTFSYSITAGNDLGKFFVQTDGDIVVAGDIDYDISPTFSLTVEVSDGSYIGSGTFTIEVEERDETAPSPLSFSPADEAINVSPSADLVITFDEEVVGSGQAKYARVKRKSNDEILMSMAMHDPAVTDVSGSTVTISLPSDMPESTELYIEIPASAIQDLKGNLYAGFADNETWDFTTADITPPTITNFSPVNGAVSVGNDEPIVLTFSEPIQQTNYPNDFIRIRRVSNNDTFHEIEAEDATQVTIDGNVVTIQPAGGIIDTEEEVQVYVQWSSTPFEDLSGNDFNDLFSSSDYRFTVDNTPAFITWNGSVWSNGTGPGAGSDDVVIAGNYTTGTHGAIDVKNITINEGFTYTVSAGDQLYVVEDINNNGSLVIESGGDLMSFETGSITGNNIEIYRNTTYADGRYSFVGTPMEQSANNTNTTIGSHVYYYDESQPYDPNEGLGRWITMSGELLPGAGYTQANQEIILFEGFPNVSTVNVTGTYTGTPNDGINEENEGWMLVANPFSTAIDVADFLAANSFTIEGSVYLWDDNGSDNGRGTNSDYIVANSEMATNTTPAGGGDRYDGVLGSAQGFFVKLKSNFGTQISFNPDQRVTGSNSDDNFFRKSITPHARINLTNTEGLFKQTIVAWKEGISDDLANQSFDAKVFSSRSADLIYTTKGEANLAIQGISNERELIELVVNVSETGTYTLGIENKSAAPGKRLYLYDAETDELVDLSISDHTFSASAGQIKNRFELRTASRALALEDENVNIYAFNKTLHIETAGSQPAQYQIFNLSGVSVLKALVAGSTQIDLGHLSNGVYIVSDGVETKKIILK